MEDFFNSIVNLENFSAGAVIAAVVASWKEGDRKTRILMAVGGFVAVVIVLSLLRGLFG